MSRPVVISRRAHNGSLTSEPDSMSQNYPTKPGPERSREGWNPRPSSRSKSRQEKGPDTSTPVKEEKSRNSQRHQLVDDTDFEDTKSGVRRSLDDELAACNFTTNGSTFEPGGSYLGGQVSTQYQVCQPNQMSSGTVPNSSQMHEQSPTYSTTTNKKSFASEFENGTIQAQRQELQLLISELKDRDCELNNMVRSHQEQLQAWEDDRQRLQALEQKNIHIEAAIKRKNDQIRALVSRLKARETSDQATGLALEKVRLQLSTKAEQYSQINTQLKETKEKNKQMGSMVQEFSSTLGRLESKEQEMLTVLRQKDNDLLAASNTVAALTGKLKAVETKLKQTQKESEKRKIEHEEVKEKLKSYSSEVERLKSDLDRSRLEEDGSKMELEKAKREVEKVKSHMNMMHEREKRQEELIASQRNKQERTDSELSSLRLLYERQQRDMSMLHLNLERTKELLLRQQQNADVEQCNISLLLASPTSGKPVEHHREEEEHISVNVAHTSRCLDGHTLTTHQQTATAHLKFKPAPPEGTPESVDTGYVSGTPLGGSSSGSGAFSAADDIKFSADDIKTTASPEQQQALTQKQARGASRSSSIPVRVDGSKATPRPNTPVSQLNESIRNISEQSNKLSQIIEASRLKRAEEGNLVRNELVKHLAMSQETEKLVKLDSQQTDVSVNNNSSQNKSRLSNSGRSSTARHYSFPYTGHHESINLSGSDPGNFSDCQKDDKEKKEDGDLEAPRDGFATPPRTTRTCTSTPSPKALAAHSFMSAHSQSSTSSGAQKKSHRVSFQDSDVAERPDELSTSQRSRSRDRDAEGNASRDSRGKYDWEEGPSDLYQNNPDSPDLSSIRSEVSQDISSHVAESPTSKLHRLLTESRQMVQSLERSTYPPFFPQDGLSPIKPEESPSGDDSS